MLSHGGALLRIPSMDFRTIIPEPGNAAPDRWAVADVEQSIPSRFEYQASLLPAKIAIEGATWRPTFFELNASANRQAHALLGGNGRPGGRVALLLRHDAGLVVAVLGVLKAGRVVVVLNPEDPPSHLEKLRLDAEPEIVITDHQHHALATRAGFSPGNILIAGEGVEKFPDTNPCLPVLPRDTAVLIQTSGSTGKPMSVIQTHRNVLHNVLRITNGLGLRSNDRFALLASLSGGLGIATTWISLLNGATLCPFAIPEKGFAGLASWLVDQRITIYTSATSVFRHFIKTINKGDRFPDIRIVRLGSEPVLHSDFKAYLQHFGGTGVFANAFACSEAGNIAQCLLGGDSVFRDDRIPAGELSQGIKVSLLDEVGAEVPMGEVGEIVIQSDYLSPGYWRNDALTAQRFLFNEPGGQGRRFRSGDLGRFEENGWLTVIGRKGTKVKIHGYWVEPSEIESAILRHPGIDGAMVLAHPTPQGDCQLIACVTQRRGFTLSVEEVRQGLGETLPGYMVPTALVLMNAFPLTPHGKIDRRALVAAAESYTPALPEIVEPRDALERTLHGLFSRVLPRKPFGIKDSFFDLGGDSLAAAALFAAIAKMLYVELPLVELKNHPSVELLARRIQSAGWNLEDHPVALLSPQPAADAVNLFMWPGAGSDVMDISDLARHLGPAVALHAIQYRGADGRGNYDLSVADMAARGFALIRGIQSSGPYALCGTSFGGIVALEVARLFRDAGEEVGFLALLDTYAPGYPALKSGIGIRGRLAAWLRWLRPLGRGDDPGLPVLWRGLREKKYRLLARRHLRATDPPPRVLPMTRRFIYLQEACFVATRAYHPAPYTGAVNLFRVDTPPPAHLFIQDKTLGWKPHITGPLNITTIPGRHGWHMREPYVGALAASLGDALARVQTR